MATNFGLEILIDNSISGTDDKYAEIVRRLLQELETDTVNVTYAASYSAGSSSTNEVTITVGGTGTVGFGIRLTLDDAVYGTDDLVSLIRRVLQVLETETLTIAFTAGYTAGDRAYQLSIAVS